MKTKVIAGVMAGLSVAAVAAPTFAQTGTDATASSAAADVIFHRKMPMTQEALQEVLTRERAMLANMDALVAIQKDAMQDHITALEAAATIEDDDAREEAVIAAHEAMRESVEAAIAANPDLADMKGGPMMGFAFGGGHHGRGGPGKEMHLFEAKFGMTPEEIKAAIESGKTIEQLAEEKGVELPEGGMFFKRIINRGDAEGSSSAQ